MIKGHGNNPYEIKNPIKIDFSSNIAFNNKSAAIFNHIKEEISCLGNYPDPEATELKEKIAIHNSLSPHTILITNGSAEAFYIVAHLTAASHSAICIPSFAEYEDACRCYCHKIEYIHYHKIESEELSGFDTLWIGNPNNPDGWITPPEAIYRLCRKYPKTLFVLDEAYIELCNEKVVFSGEDGIPDNLIIIRSLTKSFGIPGLRLGYIIAQKEIINSMENNRPPWSVNSLALKAGSFIIDNYINLMPDINELCEESLLLQKSLSGIEGIVVTPSKCNFFLAHSSKITSHILKKRLIENCGILIRDASNFRGLSTSHFRIAAQDRKNNIELIQAIREVL